MTLPKTHKALVLTSRDQPLEVKEVPVPEPTPGSAIIRILSAGVVNYSEEIYTGKRPYPFPTPLIPGYGGIGRVADVGPDSTSLKHNQLVLIDATVRSRDNQDDVFLMGVMSGYSDGSRKLMDGEWRDSTWAEYAKIPLESIYPLDESKLTYSPSLNVLGRLLVPFGGLSDIDVKPGETVIITPATGPFGSAAVQVALAMGAKVIAMGRNKSALAKLESQRVVTIPLVDHETDLKRLQEHSPIDAYFDISPPMAQGCHYLKTCIMALRRRGRVSLMGGFREDVSLPHSKIMHSNIVIKGTWMSTPDQNRALIRMVENGLLEIDTDIKGEFGLEDWKKAFECAKNNAGPGELTVFKP